MYCGVDFPMRDVSRDHVKPLLVVVVIGGPIALRHVVVVIIVKAVKRQKKPTWNCWLYRSRLIDMSFSICLTRRAGRSMDFLSRVFQSALVGVKPAPSEADVFLQLDQ